MPERVPVPEQVLKQLELVPVPKVVHAPAATAPMPTHAPAATAPTVLAACETAQPAARATSFVLQSGQCGQQLKWPCESCGYQVPSAPKKLKTTNVAA